MLYVILVPEGKSPIDSVALPVAIPIPIPAPTPDNAAIPAPKTDKSIFVSSLKLHFNV